MDRVDNRYQLEIARKFCRHSNLSSGQQCFSRHALMHNTGFLFFGLARLLMKCLMVFARVGGVLHDACPHGINLRRGGAT